MKKTIIGYTDIINFPELNLFNIPCKIDTGALSSSLHCEEIIKLEKEGKEYLKVKFNNNFLLLAIDKLKYIYYLCFVN